MSPNHWLIWGIGVKDGLVGGEGFAVDASLIAADAFFAYATNYLIDTDHAIILDVEASRAIRQAEVGAARTMIDRTEARFGLQPEYLAADSAYGSAPNLAWLVKGQKIAPHIPVFDKSNRTDGAFSRADFAFDEEANRYTCPGGKHLVQFRRSYAVPRTGITKDGTRLYRARKHDCTGCDLKAQCCPNIWTFGRFPATSMRMPAMWPAPSMMDMKKIDVAAIEAARRG
jgi:hypothetical protein